MATNNLSARNLFDIALGVAASATATTAANAQNWTGFYIGAHGGYRQADAQVTSGSYAFNGGNDIYQLPGVNGNFDQNTGIYGPHVGFNWQFAPNFLVGIESDLDYGKSSKTVSNTFLGTADDGDGFTFNSSATVKLGWQGTIRGRMGFVANNWLWYTTAGVAFAKVKYNSAWTLVHSTGDFTGANSSSAEKTLTGWVIGTGIETFLTQNMLVRVEYLLEGFSDFTVPQGIGQTGTLDLDRIQKFRVGVSFKLP